MLCIHWPTCIIFSKVHNLPNKDCFTVKLIFPITDLEAYLHARMNIHNKKGYNSLVLQSHMTFFTRNYKKFI